MKKIIWLLLAANLGLLAYFNLDHILSSTPKITLSEISPEKIKLLTAEEIEALPTKTSSAPAPEVVVPTPALAPAAIATTNCFEWGVFSASSLTQAQAALDKLSLHGTVKAQTSQDAVRFWIYKPPLSTPQEAKVKAAELKKIGVDELFVVQDGKWKNAISFGIFEDEKLALKLMAELKAKGVKNIFKATRNQGEGHSSLLFDKLAVADVAALKQLKPNFPEADLKEVDCQ